MLQVTQDVAGRMMPGKPGVELPGLGSGGGLPWLAILAWALLAATAAQAAIPASERTVLANLYSYTDGSNWFPLARSGWNGPPGTECSWYGITCNAQGNSVIAVRLAGSSLYGSLPPLSGLPNLEVFDVRASAPGGFATGNLLYGRIPQLSGLTKLQEFRAGNNFMSGGIPALDGLNNLRVFECPLCGLGGGIPALNNLPKLEVFDVSGNQLTGTIPAIAGMSELSYFHAGGNHLDGAIPDLSGLQNLDSFLVNNNLLTGGTPDLIGLPRLKWFYASGNFLDGQLGALQNLPNLVWLEVGGNLLTGNLPSLDTVPMLQRFSVGANRLTGPVPDLSGVSDLIWFDVGFNQLEGSLPTVPPALLAAAGTNGSYGSARVCPNAMTPASIPPTSTDLDWNIATAFSPWSQDCVPDPLWKTRLSVVSDRNPAIAGQPFTLSIKVWGMNPSGTVTLVASSGRPPAENNPVIALCEDIPLVNSRATCTVSDLPADNSTYRILARYSGDAQNAPIDHGLDFSVSNVALLDVHYGPMVLTSTADSAQVGQPVDLVAAAWPGDEDDSPLFFYDGRVLLCGDVPVHARDGQMIGHCVTRFTTPGPHSIFVLRDLFNFLIPGGGFVPLIQNVVATAPFDANQFSLSGSWYDPATSGQGLQIEVFPDHAGNGAGLLFGNWFTFDQSGNPQWLVLQGNLSRSHGNSYDLQVGQGAGGNFDAPPIVPASVIGTASLTFHDCAHVTLTFALDDGRNGTIPHVRLTNPSACSASVPATPPAGEPAHYNDVLHSGAWYDPATSGQGLMVDIVPSQNTFFAAWFTFAPTSSASAGSTRQRWFILQVNDYTPGDLALRSVPIIATTGGVFNQPSTVVREQVGTADVTFTSCSSMTLAYSFTGGEFSGLSGTISEHAIVANPACQ